MNNEKQIYVNQVGYLPDSAKFAYATGFSGGEEFSITNNKGDVVLKSKFSTPVIDDTSKEAVCCGDFSSITQEGDYKITCQGIESYCFSIKPKVYHSLFQSTLKYFYFSRCGETIVDSQWGHEACHTAKAEVYGTNELIDVTGGWHDAGDYGRYIVAGAKTVMDLLLAYDACKDSYTEFDILDEVRFELEWMLQLQRKDGAVYHKISCYHFCAFIMPEKELDKIVVAPVSTAATADFAGCAAYAAKYYEATDKAFSKKLLDAAKKAQDYLSTHEDELYKNPPEITTGGYGDWNVCDERYFALCSLFAATKKREYLNQAIEVRKFAMAMKVEEDQPWKKNWYEAFGWSCVSAYGTEILLKNADLVQDENLICELKASIITRAEKLLEVSNKASYGTCLEKYFWGSNGQICDEAHILILAKNLTGKNEYFEAAKKQLHYILGCNPLNLCYVTGNGSNPVKNPHHRPSGALGKTMPGMLAGGPCEGLHDQVAKEHLEGKSPLKCFIDHQGSYSTNEVAIYWNSPLVYLLANVL